MIGAGLFKVTYAPEVGTLVVECDYQLQGVTELFCIGYACSMHLYRTIEVRPVSKHISKFLSHKQCRSLLVQQVVLLYVFFKRFDIPYAVGNGSGFCIVAVAVCPGTLLAREKDTCNGYQQYKNGLSHSNGSCYPQI